MSRNGKSQPQKRVSEVCCLCARTNLVTWDGIM